MSKEEEKEIRVRLAPSPTGALHVGTARTALFNYLFAKKRGGKFILRIEDTDSERSQKKWEKDIIDNLKWLGLDWDEGPYRQSKRIKIYNKYLKKLLDEGKAYRCFCTKEELEYQKEQQIKQGEPPRYTGKCRGLSQEKIEENLKEGKPFVIRLKNINHNRTIKFNDLIRGEVEFESNLLGDFALSKGFDQPLYNFAVVVDDHDMNISHVIRGEDHIPNTPKQILVREALGFERSPEFAHLPLILGEDESKLSKRHGAVSVSKYREQGYLPEAMINFMAFMGWNPGSRKEIYSMEELIEDFDLEQVQKGGSQFNLEKLEWLNGNYIRKKPLEQLTKECIPYLIKNNLIKETEENSDSVSSGNPERQLFDKMEKFKVKETGEVVDLGYLKGVVSLYQERLKRLSEITELVDFLFKEELDYNKELLVWKEMNDKELIKIFDKLLKILDKIDKWNEKKIEETLMPAAEEVGDRGKMLWPLRAALTGKKESAGPFEIAEVLGKEKTLKRIKQAKKKINSKQ